ncbi:MAG: hypothetical protein ACI35Z_15540 [Sphingobacterium hotanense]
MKTNLLEVERQLSQLESDYSAKVTEFETYKKSYHLKMAELIRQREIIMNGLDLDRIKNAELLLRVEGLKRGEYSDRCVLAAIKDIAEGTNLMSERYFGVKNYAHWTHQEWDSRYGYGPTHGHIVFSVGLRKPEIPLTDEQKEDCLYYLNLLKDKDTRNRIVKPKEMV